MSIFKNIIMGKIKSKGIRKAAKLLLREEIDFTDSFEENKRLLGNNTMPSKKVRNQLAGLLTKIKKEEKLEE